MLHLPSKLQRDIWAGRRAFVEDAFNVHLVDVIHGLDELVRRWSEPAHFKALRLSRSPKPENFVSAEPREDAVIERVIGRQAELADFVGNSEAAEMLHRPRVLAVALGVPPRGVSSVEDR